MIDDDFEGDATDAQADGIWTYATTLHEGRRFERQANGTWLSAGGEGYVLSRDRVTGTLVVRDKAGNIVPSLIEDLDLAPVNFGALDRRGGRL